MTDHPDDDFIPGLMAFFADLVLCFACGVAGAVILMGVLL
jgi:hypothetical protein